MKSELLDPTQCLLDLKFQDWTADVRILKRGEETRLPKCSSSEASSYIERLKLRLAQTPGYIVPYATLTQDVYGKVGERELKIVSGYLSLLKCRATEPTPLFNAPFLGYAYGVRAFGLNRTDIPLIYRLWQDMGEDVTLNQLSLALFGLDNTVALNSTRSALLRLKNQRLPSTDVRIARRRQKNRKQGFFIEVIRKQENRDINEYVPPYLRTGFQDWLATEEVGILNRKERSSELLKPFPHMMIHSPKLLALLRSYSGYLVPFDYISWKVFNSYGQKDKIKALIGRIRDYLTDPDYVYLLRDTGLAIGIDSLKLGPARLEILHRLWQRQGTFVTSDELLGFTPGEDRDLAQKKVNHRVLEIQKVLVKSAYQVTKAGHSYNLHHR